MAPVLSVKSAKRFWRIYQEKQ